MKLYVAVRYKGTQNQAEIEALCDAVRHASMEDFCFVRDIEHYRKTFQTPQELWRRTLQELQTCDGLLIDVSDKPTGGRVLEAGMAYALNMPVFVAIQAGLVHKEIFAGIATTIITYTRYTDITAALRAFTQSAQPL